MRRVRDPTLPAAMRHGSWCVCQLPAAGQGLMSVCVGFVGVLANPPQEQPVSKGAVGRAEGHRVWAGGQLDKYQYQGSTWDK